MQRTIFISSLRLDLGGQFQNMFLSETHNQIFVEQSETYQAEVLKAF